jgi:hypothetical protein
MRYRPQFRLSTLLWITLAVACWFGGATFGKRRAVQETVIDVTHAQGTTFTKYADGHIVAEIETAAGSEFLVMPRLPDSTGYFRVTASDGTRIAVGGKFFGYKRPAR